MRPYCATVPGRLADADRRPEGAAVDTQRYDAAGLVLWLVAALNLLSGVPLLVVGATDGDGTALAMGAILVATALLLGGLGLAVRGGSRPAVIAAVIVLGLVLALRAVPLLRGDVGLGTIVGVLITGAMLFVVARPLAR